MKKKLSIALCIGLAIAISLYFVTRHHKKTSPKVQTTVVHVQIVHKEHLPLTVNALGQIIAPKTIMLKNKVAGNISAIYFKEGEKVTQGDPLLLIDNNTEKATLSEREANYQSLKTQYHRYIKLLKAYRGAVSKDTISQTKAKMLAAKAEVAVAENALKNTLIRAPFSGTIGRLQASTNNLSIGGHLQSQATQLTVGTYLPSNSSIAILSNTTQVLVQYQVPQSNTRYLKTGQAVNVSTSAFPKDHFPGTVIAISPVVLENSQTYSIVARIKNIGAELKSGMKVFVTQTLLKDRQILTVPGMSLVPSLNGYSVYMIEDHKVKAVPVVIGTRYNQVVTIQSGLKAGDKIIALGIGKVQPGSHVTAAK